MTLPMQQQKHVETWQASGLSQAAYCREHKLNAKTFSNWLRIYRIEQTGTKVSTIIPVTIKSAASLTERLHLCTASGHLLQLPANVSPQWLGELLKCLA
jgi:hypothetical protein